MPKPTLNDLKKIAGTAYLVMPITLGGNQENLGPRQALLLDMAKEFWKRMAQGERQYFSSEIFFTHPFVVEVFQSFFPGLENYHMKELAEKFSTKVIENLETPEDRERYFQQALQFIFPS